MRIYPIGVVQPKTTIRKVQNSNLSNAEAPKELSFKGWKAGLGSLIGTGLGLAVGTALSGGLLVPFIIGGAGSIAGGIYGSSKEDSSEHYDDPDPDWHIRD